MKIKSTVVGLIFATSMIAAGSSQALGFGLFGKTSQPTCATCTTQEGVSGIGWHMVPCDTCYRPAPTWQHYVSGGYAPPVTGRGGFFFGL
ncbi:MAG: hypothetical protein H0U73_06255 [Tatlockia sp.]|nr:hypothetical protein [Tatlockia sp.]